jgi:hypothetical protein
LQRANLKVRKWTGKFKSIIRLIEERFFHNTCNIKISFIDVSKLRNWWYVQLTHSEHVKQEDGRFHLEENMFYELLTFNAWVRLVPLTAITADREHVHTNKSPFSLQINQGVFNLSSVVVCVTAPSLCICFILLLTPSDCMVSELVLSWKAAFDPPARVLPEALCWMCPMKSLPLHSLWHAFRHLMATLSFSETRRMTYYLLLIFILYMNNLKWWKLIG